MWVANVPDCAFIISAAKCGEVPLPGVPKLKAPELALTSPVKRAQRLAPCHFGRLPKRPRALNASITRSQ